MSEDNTIIPIDHEAYQKTQAQLDAIEQEIKATQPLTSQRLDVSSLKEHYAEGTSRYFLLGIDELATRYSKIRKTRGDGNCYYRSFLYNLCESLLTSNQPLERARVLQYGTSRDTSRLFSIWKLSPTHRFLLIFISSFSTHVFNKQ